MIYTGTLRPLKRGSYYGIPVSSSAVQSYLVDLESYLGEDTFRQIVADKEQRDGKDSYHLTVVDPKENRFLREPLEKKSYDIEISGIGFAGTAYFLVVESPQLDSLRSSLGLPSKDFHITLGFHGRDTHGVAKDSSTLLKI